MHGIPSAISTKLKKSLYALANLFKTLEEEILLDSVYILSLEAREELQLFEFRLKEAFVYHVDPSLPLNLLIPHPLNCVLQVYSTRR